MIMRNVSTYKSTSHVTCNENGLEEISIDHENGFIERVAALFADGKWYPRTSSDVWECVHGAWVDKSTRETVGAEMQAHLGFVRCCMKALLIED